jgi:hypothetical protein
VNGHEIQTGWLVNVPSGYGGLVTLGVLFDEETVEDMRTSSLCDVTPTTVVTLSPEARAGLPKDAVFVGDEFVTLAEATKRRLAHRHRRALGLDHDTEKADAEPLSFLHGESYERRQLLVTTLTKPEVRALGLERDLEAAWDQIMDGQERSMERRRAEIEAHPLIGRVFEAESNSKHADSKRHIGNYEYVVTGFDRESGKYRVHSHGRFACITPGAFNEDLLYSAEEIEAGTLSDHKRNATVAYGRKRSDLSYDAEGNPYVAHEREVHRTIVDHREEAV